MIKSVFIIAFSCTVLILFTYPVSANSRAVIISPRLGCALQGPRTAGRGLNKTEFLNDTLSVYIAPDPPESPIPAEWRQESFWSVALVPSVLEGIDCIVLQVETIRTRVNSFSAFGGGLGQNPLYPSAVELVCKIPANIEPVVYDLAVSFKQAISPALQRDGSIDLVPAPGSWQGFKGSAYQGPFSLAPPFLLTEPSCVSIPWIYDAYSSDKVGQSTGEGNAVKPFSFIHITDSHYKNDRPDWLSNNELWENDSQVLAPDFIALSGDLVEGPHEDPTEMLLAYGKLRSLGIPLAVTLGNHDHKLSGLWRHYIGPMYSAFQFDDVSVISFDTGLPFGTGVLNWLDNEAAKAVKEGPTFFMCHYPVSHDYFSGGWQGTADIMVERNVTGLLTGHTHGDFLSEVEPLRDRKLEAGDYATFEDINDDYNDLNKHLKPIKKPLQIITRTAAKDGYVRYDLSLPRFSGYRELTVAENKVYNYTYDYDGNGVRDAQISIPGGRFATEVVESAGNYQWKLTNDYNHRLSAARAIFRVPNPATGMMWELIGLNKTNGAYIRSMVNNGTMTFIDARVPVAKNQDIILEIEQVPEAL